MRLPLHCLLALSLFLAPGLSRADETELRKEVELLRDELEKAKAENEQLREQIAAMKAAQRKKTPEGDLFAVGDIWRGQRTVKGAPPAPCRLLVLTREGDGFTGTFTFTAGDNKVHTMDVLGTAPVKDVGKVAFKTGARALLQQTYEGTLSGGQISLRFSGASNIGKPVVGTVTLSQ